MQQAMSDPHHDLTRTEIPAFPDEIKVTLSSNSPDSGGSPEVTIPLRQRSSINDWATYSLNIRELDVVLTVTLNRALTPESATVAPSLKAGYQATVTVGDLTTTVHVNNSGRP